jgi:hypothetical protein
VTIEGDPEANEILVVGDIGREDIHCAIGHILFLVQNERRIRTTFNTTEGYRMRVEEGDITLERVLVLHIDPAEFAVEGESSHLCERPGVALYIYVRPDLAPILSRRIILMRAGCSLVQTPSPVRDGRKGLFVKREVPEMVELSPE